MNCLEFRRLALVDPRGVDGKAAEHVAGCLQCKGFIARLLEDEARLVSGINVPVPDRLHSRLHTRLFEQTARFRRTRWLAVAASVVVAVIVTIAFGWSRDDPLALAGIDFVVYDEAQSIVDAKPTDMQELARVARKMGVSLPAELGDISYVCFYPFVGGAAHHLLIKSPRGKVTLLLIPSRSLESRVVVTARGLEAVALPAVAGSMVIIGENDRGIRRVEALLTSG